MEPFVGEIKAVGWNFAARGYAMCNGQILSIAQNSALFSLLGTTYGGNGQVTFALPNLQGRVPIHQGQSPGTSMFSLGEVGGVESTTLAINQMPMHNHTAVTTVTPTYTEPTAATTINVLTQPTSRQAGPANAFLTAGQDNNGVPVNNFAPVGGGTANTMNPGVATTSLSGGSVAATAATQVGVNGGSQPFGIQQPYLVLTYLIALEGVFPSRN